MGVFDGQNNLGFRPVARAAAMAVGTALAAVVLVGCADNKSVGKVPPPTLSYKPVSPGPLTQVPTQYGSVPSTYTPTPRQPAYTAPKLNANGIPRDWIPSRPAAGWLYIVIHHSASEKGSEESINREHIRGRGWAMVGYHFVVGNGTFTPNGTVEPTPRWSDQLVGAHTHTPDNEYNKRGIGVCLVGNFDKTRPSAQQLQATSRLVAYLMKTYHIPASRVIGHRQAKPTDCPGNNFPLAQLKSMATQQLADAGIVIPDSPLMASTDTGTDMLTGTDPAETPVGIDADTELLHDTEIPVASKP